MCARRSLSAFRDAASVLRSVYRRSGGYLRQEAARRIFEGLPRALAGSPSESVSKRTFIPEAERFREKSLFDPKAFCPAPRQKCK